jgi:molybdopterin-guanine dinucleotide biosynthesis protein A
VTAGPTGERVVAALIAGGGARRLGGVPKGSLLVGGRPLLERQLEVLRPLFPRLFVVSARPGPWPAFGLQVVPDRIGDSGPLAGLDAAVAALQPGERAVVCVGADLPFLRPALLAHLRDAPPTTPGLALVPRRDGRAEPLLARYERGCAPVLARALAEGRRKLQEVIPTLGPEWLTEERLRGLDPALDSFVNVNTPEDLAAAEARAAYLDQA